MKKFKNILLIITLAFLLGFKTDVLANPITPDDIKQISETEVNGEKVYDNVYIIGTHLFVNVMTLDDIMTGARSIPEGEENIVYRRSTEGKWINEVTGKEIEENGVPESFDIKHINRTEYITGQISYDLTEHDGIIQWKNADEDNEILAGHVLPVVITPPADYNIKDAEITVDGTKLEENTTDLGVYVNDDLDNVVIKVKWNEVSTQTFTINFENNKLQYPKLTSIISTNLSSNELATVTNDALNYTFEGTIKWFPEQVEPDLPRAAGYRVGLKITAPEGYDQTKFEFTYGETPYNNEQLFTGKTSFGWYPLVTKAGQEFTATIQWNPNSIETITIKISDEAALEETLDSVKHFAIVELENYVDKDDYEKNIEELNSAILAGRDAINSQLTKDGVSVALGNAKDAIDEIESDLDIAIKEAITAAEAAINLIPGIEVLKLADHELVTEARTKVDEALDLDKTVIISNIEKLVAAEEKISTLEKGSITSFGQNGIKEGYSIKFTGEVKWYEADTDVGRNVEGNRVGVKITKPEGFDTTNTTVKIGETTYKWSEIKDGDGSYFEWWPLITSNETQTLTAEITWAEGITQTFSIILKGITLEVDPHLKDLTVTTGDTEVHGFTRKTTGDIIIANDVADEVGLITNETTLADLNGQVPGEGGDATKGYTGFNITLDSETEAKSIKVWANGVEKTATLDSENLIKLYAALANKTSEADKDVWKVNFDKVEWKLEWFDSENKLIARTYFTTQVKSN